MSVGGGMRPPLFADGARGMTRFGTSLSPSSRIELLTKVIEDALARLRHLSAQDRLESAHIVTDLERIAALASHLLGDALASDKWEN